MVVVKNLAIWGIVVRMVKFMGVLNSDLLVDIAWDLDDFNSWDLDVVCLDVVNCSGG